MGWALTTAGLRRLIILGKGDENVQVTAWQCFAALPTILFSLAVASYHANLTITVERCIALISTRYRLWARKVAIAGLATVWVMLAIKITLGIVDTWITDPAPGTMLCFTEQVNSKKFAAVSAKYVTTISWTTVGVYVFLLLPALCRKQRRDASKVAAGTVEPHHQSQNKKKRVTTEDQAYQARQRMITRNLLKVLAVVFFMRTLPTTVMGQLIAHSKVPAFLLRYMVYVYVSLSISYAATFFVYGLSSGDIRKALVAQVMLMKRPPTN